MSPVRFVFRGHGLTLPFSSNCTAYVGDVELPGALVLAQLAVLVAQVELVRDVTLPRRPLARVAIRPYLKPAPVRRLVGADGRKLRGLTA